MLRSQRVHPGKPGPMARRRGTPGAARDRLKASSVEPKRVAEVSKKKGSGGWRTR